MKPFDLVNALGSASFWTRHPRVGWPKWFERAAVFGASKVDERRWNFSVTIPLDGSLGVNESWEMIRGHKELVTTNPLTGERRVTISKSSAGVIRVFEAMIDPSTQSIDVQFECSPSVIEIPTGLYLWDESRHV